MTAFDNLFTMPYCMVISVIGAGYVGLVTGAVFSDFGHKVFCVDIDKDKVESLNKGKIPFFEPNLEEVVKRNLEQKRLFFTTNYAQAIPSSKVVFVCVGTPPLDNGECDLSYLFASVQETAKHLKGYTLIAIKSTVPLGVEETLRNLIGKTTKVRFEFASCPEFLREGSAVEDTRNPDRIVIGTKSTKAADILLDLYKHFNGQRLVCDLRSAQMVKYAANTLLATKISFANAIANLCERTGADVEAVLTGVGLDKRIGRTFLYPGIGYGGSCLPKDVSAFIDVAEKSGYHFKLLEAIEEINNGQVDMFIEKISSVLGSLEGKNLAVLGLAFKPNTDDTREAPALKIINRLLKMGAKIKAYDPVATSNARHILKDTIVYVKDPYQAIENANALLLTTEWNEFRELDLEKIKKMMADPVIIDGRNMYDPKRIKSLGFTYRGIGRS